MAWFSGYPREKIQWFPNINSSKCIKCGMCMNCGKKVFEWTKKGPKVVRPYQCVVGCTTCANLCPVYAIIFPGLEENVRSIYKREGIWSKVKKQLEEEGRLKTGE